MAAVAVIAFIFRTWIRIGGWSGWNYDRSAKRTIEELSVILLDFYGRKRCAQTNHHSQSDDVLDVYRFKLNFKTQS